MVAVASVVFSGLAFLSPSKSKLNLAYILVAATVASGTYLAIVHSSNLASVCVTGLFYLGLVLPAIVSARHKLVRLSDK